MSLKKRIPPKNKKTELPILCPRFNVTVFIQIPLPLATLGYKTSVIARAVTEVAKTEKMIAGLLQCLPKGQKRPLSDILGLRL